MTDDPKPTAGQIPPRLKLEPSAAGNSPSDASSAASADIKKQTRRVEVPATPPPQDAAATLKKKTSRIPLEQVTAESNATLATPTAGKGLSSKTIRLSPAPPAPPSLSIPTSIPPVRPAMGTMAPGDAKRQTSRIPLDAVLSGTAAGEMTGTGASGGPKTIRIKRPDQSQPARLEPGAPEAATPAPSAADLAAAKRTTSRLELPDEAATEAQTTQRKTIKIRRTDGAGTLKTAPRSVAVARVEARVAEFEAEQAAAESIPVLYPIAAALAFVLLCAMLYLLVIQAFPATA